MSLQEIDVHEAKKKLEGENPPFLLDVREPFEHEFANIEGQVIPLGELPDRISELESHKNDEIIVYCRSGSRSAEACRLLESSGFSNVKNLSGGILAWSDEIDPEIPQY